MLYLIFADPRIDGEAVQVMMNQYRTSLALRDEDPKTALSDEIDRMIHGGLRHFKPLELNDLSKVNFDTALAFIRKAFNPADYTFVFIGNLDLAIMREYVESCLAAIPRGESWNTWTDLNIKRPGKVEKTVYKGREEQSSVYMAWFSKASYSDEIDVITDVLNEYLDIKLNDEIREKLGGVYSISAAVLSCPR